MIQKRTTFYQELMSHPKGGEGAFNYVVTALSKVLNCCAHVRQEGNPLCGSLGCNSLVLIKCLHAQRCDTRVHPRHVPLHQLLSVSAATKHLCCCENGRDENFPEAIGDAANAATPR